MEKRVFKSNFLKGAVCAALAALLCAALLTCSNAAGGSDAPSSQQSVSSSSRKPGYVTLTGTVSVSGAVPQILADTPDASDNDASRSAHPSIDVSGETATMEYFATATCGSDVVNGTFGSGREAKKFGIELAASKTWSVVVGVRSKTADAEGNKKIYLQSKPWSVTPDPADPTISHNFVPVPNTSGGEGKIELNVNCSALSNSLRVKFISGPDGVNLSAISAAVTNNGGNGKIIKVDSVKSGVYELCLDFLTPFPGYMLEYSSLQTVTVADGMTTNAWVDDANESALSPISGGEFKFNNDNRDGLTAAFLGTTVFVGKVSSDSAEPDDSNSGNFLSPFKTITRAAERINAVGKGDLDYYIRVSGEVSGTSSTSAAVIQNLAAAKAKSLTIIGTSGPDADCIKSVTYQHSALNVTTPVPIKLKNIKIVGATGAGNGDAVSAWGSANVIIEDSVEITGADVGVSVSDSASVTMKGGTISGNVTAVDLQGGDFILQGGSIPYDTSISTTKKNDVKLASGKVIKVQGDLTAVTGDKIGVTPSERKRGVKVVDTSAATANAATVEGKFLITDPTITATNPLGDEWKVVAVATSTEHALKTNAPIYVGQAPDGTAGDNDNPGTKSLPYFSIERACQDMDDADMPYTINVRGKLPAQTIPDTLSKASTGTYKAKSVLIKGVNPIPTSGADAGVPQDQIQVGLGGTTVTSALTVASSVPITIQNLKITGGEHANGGGLYLNSGTEVHLESGVLITDNTARNHGGGVYCAGGKLFINEGAKICGNHVSPSSGNYGGIGLYANSSAEITMTGGEISSNKNTSDLDVKGGGVKLEGGATFRMSAGEVKDNQTRMHGANFYVNGGKVYLSGTGKITGGYIEATSNNDAIGAAMWLQASNAVFEMSGGEISGNKVKGKTGYTACAGIYVTSGATFTMTGGKIASNEILNGNKLGGAVRLNSDCTFNISGSASIPYGGAVGNNDVYLAQSTSGTPAVTTYAKINIANDITTTGTVATITPQKYKRGMPILSGTDTRLSSYKAKFPLSENDGDWTKNIASSQLTINADVYVAGTSPTTVSGVDYGKGLTVADGGLGTKSKPFKLISEAVGVFEDATPEAIVTVVGTASDVAQEIPSSFTTSQAVKLTLKGLSSSSVGTIKRYTTAPSSAAVDGSALTINSTVPVTIQDLEITGGYKSGTPGGGGVCLTAGTLKLGNGAKITGNRAFQYGGGIYVASGAKLFMYGSSFVGDSLAYTATSAALSTDGTTGCANSAKAGGGIYSEGSVYIGYDGLTGDTPNKHDMDAGYGVCRNYASGSTDSGGGIQNKAGSVLIASGSVSYNQSVNCGGGIFGVGSVTIDEPVTGTKKLVMYGNKAKIGGAIGLFTGCNLTMSGGQIGGNTSAKQNTATENGGAVYQGATFKVSGSALIYPSTTANTNDVYLPTGTYVTAGSIGTNGNTSSSRMPLTPQEPKRGTQIVLADGVTVNSTLWGKFSLTSDDTGWDREAKTVGTGSSAKNYVALNSPVYVVGTSASNSTRPDNTWGYGTAEGNGTKTSPYSSIADALGCPELSVATEPNTITVAGTLKGIQSISGTVPASLALKGYNTSATIDGNSCGSALTVNASGKTITITSLKITGGSGTAETVSGVTQNNGGGIYLKAGTVNLGDNAVITGNNVSTNGGGVYVAASGATLFMYGKALIGDSATSTTLASSSGTSYYANKAAYGAGIYNNGGAVYIGCNSSGTAASGYALVNNATNGYYGVRRNLCTTSGAGIYHASGTLKIASGDISYNFANTTGTTSGGAAYFNANAAISGGTFTGNKAANGGAFYIKAGKELTIDGSATITKNVAVLTGGAVCNDGTLTMSAGSIGAASALNSVTSNVGGAIYQNGTFNISGSAVVYAGTGVGEKQNDVYLTSTTKYITVNDSINNGSDPIASVTPSTWKRGNQVIAPDGTTITSINATVAGRFAVSDSEWSVTNHSNVGKLDAQLWVSGTGYDSTNGVGAGDDSKRGTKSKPYKTIKKAAEQCWTTDKAFTINISGMITGATQEIPAATTTTTLASKITLSGYTGNTTHGIDRGLASESAVSGGSALIINYQGYVDITNLKIMGGNTTGNGGGILINGSSSLISSRTSSRVNLKNGTLIQQNQAVNGGGVYSSCAILCLSGSATIGSNADTPDRSTASTALSTGINKATTSGGGIYSTSSYLYFGAAWVGSGPNTTGYTLTKGVYGNVCTVDSNATAANQKKAAGGVYNYGVFYFMSGNINCNYGVMTGGVYNNYSTGYGFCMTGGSIHKNNGCGVYNDTSGEFSMSGDAYIGDSGASSRATSATDCSNSKGGLVNVGTAKLGYSYGSKTKLSGGIYRNYLGTGSKNDGGAGIKNTGTLYFDSGTISYNYAYCTQSQEAGGGGIFSNSTVYMTSSSSSQYSCVKDNKCSEAGGGIYLDGSSAKLLMSGYAIIGKAGETTPPSSATAAGANTAKYGAGIGSSGGATICLGYSSFTNMDTNTPESLDNGGICYNYATINGGGIYCQGSSTSSINIYMASGKINANNVYYTSSTTYGNGGGIWTNMYATIYMGGGQISKNSASTFGGGVYVAGKLYMYGNALIGDTGSSVATTGNYGNTAVTGGGVYVTSANGGVFMGCIKEASGGVQYETLNSSYGIRHNYASGASSDIEPSSGIPTGFGGGVYSNKATLFVASGTIGYNLAAKGGGAAILGHYQSIGYTPCLDGSNSKIEGNKATADGGGLYIKKDTFEIRGSISSNTAGSDGGGVYNYWSDLEISGNDAKINSNKAQNGGGIYIPEDGSESSGNTSFTKLQNGAQINSNEATYCGGGIYNYDATLEIYASSISYNKAVNSAAGKGGAMYIRSGGYTRIVSGTVTMTPTSGYERQARYNDIYPENDRAFSLYTAAVTISGKVYITLPSTVAADAEIILICGTYPYTPLQSSTYLLTTGSYYYNVKTINTSTGKLN